MHVAKFLTGWSMVIIILVLASAGIFINRDKILALASTMQARFTPPTLETGLIGYWSFNGADVTDKVYDRSGQSYNGYFSGGATTTAKVSGKMGQALRFDGVDDYIVIGDQLDSLTAYTVTAWVKHDSLTDDDDIVFKHNQTLGFYLRRDDVGSVSGRTDMYKCNADAGATESIIEGTTGTSVENVWTFVACTFTGGQANGLRLYVNGIEDAGSPTTTASVANTGNSTTNLVIGRNEALGNGNFDGLIDEVRIYNRALSADEIYRLYNQGVGSKIQASQNDQVSDGLVAHWTFDGADLSGVTQFSTAYDVTGNGNDGELQNSLSKTSGVVSQALSFAGNSNRYINVGDLTAIEGQSAVTLTAWVKPRVMNDWSAIFSKQSGPSSDITVSAAGPGNNDNSAIVATMRNGSNTYGWTGTGKLSTSTWTHVAMVFDGTQTGNANRFKIFVNGVSETLTFTGTIPATTVANANDMFIGMTGLSSYYWNGVIDDARAYNRALSAREVEHLYNQGVGSKANASQNDQMTEDLLSLWSFDGADVTDKVYDRSGNGKNGFVVNMSTTSAKIPGKIGQALTFDGANDRVDTVVGSLSGPYSISVWVKPTNVTTNGYIFSEHTSGDTNTHRVMWLKGAVLSGAWGLTGTSYTVDGVYRQTASGVVTPGEWQHLVATYDGGTAASGIHLYRNGVESPSYTLSVDSSGSPETGGGTWSIGGRKYDNARNLDGSLDDVRVYDKVLSPEEVLRLYNKGR